MVSNASGQANPTMGVLPANSGIVAVGATLDLEITVGNTNTGSIPAYKIRPVITVPNLIVTILPNAQQTGLPPLWSIVSNDGTQIRICNGLDVIPSNANRTIFIKVIAIAVGGPSTFAGQITFGSATTCASAGPTVTGNNTADDNATSTITVIAAAPCTITASATAGTIACNGGTTTLTAASAGTANAVEYSINGGTSYQTSPTFTVPAGTYTVIARETATPSCTATATAVVISQPAAFVPGASVTTPIATIGGTGSITVTGGVSYVVTSGTTTNTTGASSGVFTGLLAGSYTFTATSAAGCTGTSAAVVLNDPAACIITGVTATAGTIACNGGTTTLTATAAPAGSYQFSLNGGAFQAGNTFTVPAGSYTVTAREVGNLACTATSLALVVSQPIALVAASSFTAILCNGGNSTVTVSATGGTAPYTGTGTFTNTAGAYTYTVTDANGCTSVTTGTITQPTAIVVSATFAPIAVFNGTTTVNVSATGGTGAFTGTGAFVRAAGTFTFTVTDANGCTGTATITIGAFATAVIADPAVGQMDFTTMANVLQNANTLAFNNPLLPPPASQVLVPTVYKLNIPFYNRSQDNAVPNGTIQLRVNLGTKLNIATGFNLATAPLNTTFSWSTVTIADSVIIIGTQIASIPADFDGVLTFNVVGKATCAANVRTRIIITNTAALLTDEDLLNNNSTLRYTLPATVTTTQTNVTCNGFGNGIINVTPSLGATFAVTNSLGAAVPGGTVNPVTGLAPGVYTITVSATSEVGLGISCAVTTTVTIVQPLALAATNNPATTINNLCNGGNDGSIRVVPTGGTAPYSFVIAGPTVNTTGVSTGIFTNLLAGTYTITTTDANGCTAVVSGIIVTQPTGTAPDISLGSDFTGNFFAINGASRTIVYNVTEIAGNPAVGDTIRINKVSGFNITFNPSTASQVVGSTTYVLDNSRWKIDNSNATFTSIILTDPFNALNPGTLLCREQVFVSVTLTRNTPNVSTFTLSARLRRANGELNLLNNLNSIVFVAD